VLDDQFDFAEAFLTVAIALDGIAVLTRKRWLLGFAILLTALGLAFGVRDSPVGRSTPRGWRGFSAEREPMTDRTVRQLDLGTLPLFEDALERLDRSFAALPSFTAAVPGAERMGEVLDAVAERLRDNLSLLSIRCTPGRC
jgi:hypothetical protein